VLPDKDFSLEAKQKNWYLSETKAFPAEELGI
jgi:hypothetical protein